jgi:N-acetylglucosaminyldiphosphoundecaprenol N-acetyl-beta-D-mannosaminyltransferase
VNRVRLLQTADVAVASSVGEAADAVVALRRSVRGGYVCLCNVHLLTTARKRAAVRAALSDAGVVFADGQPLVWLQRAAGETSARRIAGTDLLLELAGRAGPHELRHAFFGSSSSTLARVAAELSRRRPEIEIAGLVSPPMAADARELGGTWLATLAALEPDIVWCCLGAPKQELWMRRFASAL